MTNCSRLLCALFVLAASGSTCVRVASAQYDDLLILSDQTVRDELKLDAGQSRVVDGLRAARTKEWNDWYQNNYLTIPRDERGKVARKKLDAFSITVAQKHHAMLKDALQPAQLERLREIVIQLRSTSLALMLKRNPEIIESLQLSDEQMRQIENTGDRNEAIKAFGLQGDERTRAINEWAKNRNQEILDVFTAAQRAKLDALKGAPFDLSSLNGPHAQSRE
ncbi:MAG: hypothetical protein H6822_14875 [Planctomycetaceae bacterium]|nr:hypothetical protein [Planctomycetaceae bacterium]